TYYNKTKHRSRTHDRRRKSGKESKRPKTYEGDHSTNNPAIPEFGNKME
ncbi:unnamed protein product, partial [marine sediment metagenome]